MYKVDFDTLPKNCWVILPSRAASDGILDYMLKTYIKDRKILKCPTDRRPNAWLSYGENYNMKSGGEVGVYGGTDLKGGPDPSGTIYIGDWNGHNLGLYIRCTGHATTQPGDIDFRHNGWANFLMVDGSVRAYRKVDLIPHFPSDVVPGGQASPGIQPYGKGPLTYHRND